jgi:translocation and assembly module TamA
MPWIRTFRRCAALAAAVGVGQVPAHAADPQPYTVTLTPTGDSAIDAALKDSSSLAGLRQSAPVGPFALVTRAQGDSDRLQTALRSFGYYAAHTTIDIDGHAADDPDLPDLLAAMPANSTAHVTITVDRGPLFHLRHVTVDGDIPPDARAKLGIAPGDPAVAASVLAGQSNMLDALRASGHALAKVGVPDVVETPGEHVLDVTYHVDAGPRVDIGTITVNGLKATNDSYVRRRLTVHSGEQYSPATIDAARQDLSAAGIFSSVDATTPDHLAPDGTIPLTFTVTERDRHSVAFNVAYSTDTGATGGVTFTYRNVFGNAETLKLNAAITQAETDAEVQAPGYNFTATFTQPDFGRRDQTLTSSVGYVKENLYAYSRKAALASTTLSRKLSNEWTASIGLSGVQEQVLQEGVTRSYTLAGVPLGLTYDSTGPEGLFNPTHGIKAAATVTPTDSLAGHGAFFTLIQISGSTYINLAPTEGRSVLALRGLVGTAQGASSFAIPPDQRFYAGGSGTVRGYRYQSVGPLFADQRPEGGASVTAATVEYRQRFGESLGAVVFVDAGQVGTSSAPFTGTVMEGAGFGVRYYTSLGPIRLDLAAPLEKRRKDEIGEAYIGLGQAF